MDEGFLRTLVIQHGDIQERTLVMKHALLQTYIPATAITRATLKYSWGRVLVATLFAPDKLCGEARRIGYAGKQATDFALYRLKIRPSNGSPTVTLPSLYIIDNGTFVEFDQPA